MKKTITVMMLMLLALVAVFAQSTTEATKDFDMMYIPRTTANNSNIRIDLGNVVTSATAGASTSSVFSNDSTGHLSLFRISDSLENVNANSGLTLNITSLDGWRFVNEANATVYRPFRIAVAVYTGTRQSDGTYNVSSSPQITELTPSGNTCTYSIPLSSSTDKSPANTYDIDLVIWFASDDIDYSMLEQGYYSTRMKVTTTGGTNGKFQTTSGMKNALNEQITAYGYIGADPGTNTATYSFIVSDAEDSYTMNLGIANHNAKAAYKVATVRFLYSSITTSQPSGSNNTTDKFKIYVSPGPSYQSPGIYQFVKQGTESQARTNENTIYYDLYIKTGSSYTVMSTSSSSSIKATTGTIGSWKRYQDNTYQMLPLYDSVQIAEAGTHWGLFSGAQVLGTDQYQNTWTLEQDIYLKLTDTSLSSHSSHNSGLYWSYIYFTLVVT